MPTGKTVAILNSTLTGLGLVGSFWDLDDKIAGAFPVIAPHTEWIEYAFIILLGISSFTLFVLLAFTVWAFIQSYDREFKGPFRRRLQHFRCEDMKADDLETAMSIYNDTTPGQTSLEVARSVYGKCRQGWRKAVDTRDESFAGYFIVIPLAPKGIKAIEEREFGFHSTEASEYITTRHRRGGTAYIGMIGVRKNDLDARAFVLNRITHFVNARGYKRVYAKASTQDGLRLLKKKKFQTVHPEDRVELDVMFVKTMDA